MAELVPLLPKEAQEFQTRNITFARLSLYAPEEVKGACAAFGIRVDQFVKLSTQTPNAVRRALWAKSIGEIDRAIASALRAMADDLRPN